MPLASVRRSVAVALVMVMASACGGSTEETGTGDTDTPVQTATDEGGEEATDTPAESATAACEDKAGDGKGGDLTSVQLESDGETLTATFQTTEPIPAKDTALFSIDAWSQDEETGYQLGLKYLDGEQIAHFIFDYAASSQENLTSEASTEGTTTIATFPMEAISDLGETFRWSGHYNVAGNDVDACPNPGGDILNPKQETFPAN